MSNRMITEAITINYEDEHVPAAAQKLKPKLFKDGIKYCALLGADPQQGIFGCGDTPLDALNDWNDAYQYLVLKDPELKSIYGKVSTLSNVWLGYKRKAS